MACWRRCSPTPTSNSPRTPTTVPFTFRLVLATTSVDPTMRFEGWASSYAVAGATKPKVRIGHVEQPLAEFLQEERPGLQVYRRLSSCRATGRSAPNFFSRGASSAARIAAWDWSGTDI